MVKNGLELSRYLCEQAKNSGFARAAIIIILDNNGSLHKSELGLVASDQKKDENVIEMVAAKEDDKEIVLEADIEE